VASAAAPVAVGAWMRQTKQQHKAMAATTARRSLMILAI